MHKGDGGSFDTNWRKTEEANYSHFTRGPVKNQIQLAFRNHWEVACTMISKPINELKVLEIGCGRGSLSAYFADVGADCHLLDISPKAIELAKKSFASLNLSGNFYVADCEKLPFLDETFDFVFSIGLLEHFEDITLVLAEKNRVLKNDGLMFNYIVPKLPNNVQVEYEWFNDILRTYAPVNSASEKVDVFRSDLLSDRYVPVLAKLGMKEIFSSGIYPLPMISNSPEFPFTLLNEKAEEILVKKFEEQLRTRESISNIHPWLCDETVGQAILVCAVK
ncbi:class I SAM-dependent methyltransferase [Planktomarina temperata]|nr:class I SAM-dependent methyltransferase [Planktomarina temperata]MDB2459778.1 class I SAM-dependent methyltransferase [Planktomarina temperata]